MEASKYPTEMKIENVRYVREDLISNPATSAEGLPYVCVRSRESGVWLGYLKDRCASDVKLVNARRVWRWEGAAELSELANKGTSKPQNCKWPAPVPEVLIIGACEIIPCTERAKKTHDEVKIWTA